MRARRDAEVHVQATQLWNVFIGSLGKLPRKNPRLGIVPALIIILLYFVDYHGHSKHIGKGVTVFCDFF